MNFIPNFYNKQKEVFENTNSVYIPEIVLQEKILETNEEKSCSLKLYLGLMSQKKTFLCYFLYFF